MRLALLCFTLTLTGCDRHPGNEVVMAAFHAGVDIGYNAATNGVPVADVHAILDREYAREVTP